MLRRFTWGLLVLVLGASVAGVALASRTAARANPTFVLVQYPAKECPKPRVIVGKACVDKSEQLLSADWTYSDGSGTLHPTGWTTSYKWSVPAVVPASGAAIKMSLGGEAKDVGSICPGMGVGGGLPLKPAGQEIQFGACAQHGETVKASHTVTVTTPSGGPVYILIGLGDGPRFYYKYEAQAAAAPAAQKGCGTVKPTVLHWRITHSGVPRSGESPTLARASTIGVGQLTLCLGPGAKSALATEASGSFEHQDVHTLAGADDERVEGLKLRVTRAAYAANAPGSGGAKLALDVEVTRSNDRDCPVGSRGRLSLTDRPGFLNGLVVMKLCGPSHSHTFDAEDDIRVIVVISDP